MSSPVGRSSDPNSISSYAPKWAHDPNASPSLRSRLRMAREYFSDLPADDSDYVAERGLNFRSLEPSLVPEPPMPESWRHDRERPLIRNNSVSSMLLRFLLIIFLSTLISLVIVIMLPAGRHFMVAQKSTKESAATPDDNMPMSEAQSRAIAGKHMPTPVADRSELPPTPTHVERHHVSPERLAARQPEMTPFVAARPPARKTPASTELKSESSAPGKPASFVLNRWRPVSTEKTAPIRPKERARSLDADEIETLLKQGANFVSVGDFASARLVFGRVAEAGDARGAFALAVTYDPIALAKIDAKGVTPDIAKARQWYTKASELGASDAGPRLAALEKSTGASFAGSNSAISAHENAIGTKQSLNEATGENSQSSDAVGTASYWENDASIMRLVATGASRKFIYFKPSEAQRKAGAKVGSLRFDGQISGDDGYTGSAYSYSENCGRERFPVSGQIENNGGRVILTGKSPLMDSNCRKIGKIDETLVFDFIGPGAK